MKGLNFAVLILATSVVGYASSTGIIETVVTTLFSDCTVVKTLLKATYEQIIKSGNKPTPENIIVYVYGSSTSNKSGVPLEGSGNTLWNNFPGFDTTLPTEIFVHGFLQFSTSPEVNFFMDALIDKGGRNVILIDASQYIGFWYMYASSATRFIGEYLGKELARLVKNGYDVSKIHLIGFSMGAVISGIAGSTFRNITQKSLPWITGLDPAGLCFFDANASETLDKTDADFVDVIHTNAGIYGTTQQLGDVDFYPNGGSHQPGKILPFLSHNFATFLYAESVRNVRAFPAVGCDNWLLFLAGGCSWNCRTNMGYGVSKRARGKYDLTTDGDSLYNKGNDGIPPFNFFAWIVSLFV